MNNILFLDPEGTVIKSWENPAIINADKVKRFIKQGSFNKFSIFSFAIWHAKDGATFMNNMKADLETALGIEIDVELVPTIETLRRDVMSEFNLAKLSKDDFFCFNNKETAFITFCRRNFKDCTCTLIDDMIWDEISFSVRRKNLQVNTVNVNSLY